MTARTVFFGTPEFAVPALAALHEVTRVVGVVCQPDRRSGRGMKLRAPPVKAAALERGLEVLQPLKVRDGALEAWLRDLKPDIALVAAYGRILPAGVLRAPARGCVNLHASLLPAYRGAAPIQWALLDGRSETGVSLMQMDEGMDTGAVFATRRHAIAPETDGGSLTLELAQLAADMVRHEFLEVLAGSARAFPQDDSRSSSAPPIQRAQLLIDWHRSSREIANQVRAFAPAPGAFTYARRQRLKLLQAASVPRAPEQFSAAPGEVMPAPEGVAIACGQGALAVQRGQLEGRNPQDVRDLINGRVLEIGQILGELGGAAPEHDAQRAEPGGRRVPS